MSESIPYVEGAAIVSGPAARVIALELRRNWDPRSYPAPLAAIAERAIEAIEKAGARAVRPLEAFAPPSSVTGTPSPSDPEPLTESDWIGTADAAAMLDVTDRQARKLAERLGGRQVSGRWMIPRAAVEAQLKARHAR